MMNFSRFIVATTVLLVGVRAQAAPADPYESIYQELNTYSREDCKNGGTLFDKMVRQAQPLNPHQRSELALMDTGRCMALEQDYANTYYTLLHNNSIALAALKACVIKMPRPGTTEHGGMSDLAICMKPNMPNM